MTHAPRPPVCVVTSPGPPFPASAGRGAYACSCPPSPIRLGLDLKEKPRRTGLELGKRETLEVSGLTISRNPERCIWFHALPDLCVGIVSER
jgi:hypothetical protein